MLEPLFAITDDLTRRFPDGNQPYQTIWHVAIWRKSSQMDRPLSDRAKI